MRERDPQSVTSADRRSSRNAIVERSLSRPLADRDDNVSRCSQRSSAVAPAIFFHGSARPPEMFGKEFFNPTVEIEIVLWPRETVPFVGIDHVGHFALRFAQVPPPSHPSSRS